MPPESSREVSLDEIPNLIYFNTLQLVEASVVQEFAYRVCLLLLPEFVCLGLGPIELF